MRNTTKFAIVVVLATLLVFSNAVFAGNENTAEKNNATNATENVTNVTTNITETNATMNMTNATAPFEGAKEIRR